MTTIVPSSYRVLSSEVVAEGYCLRVVVQDVGALDPPYEVYNLYLPPGCRREALAEVVGHPALGGSDVHLRLAGGISICASPTRAMRKRWRM